MKTLLIVWHSRTGGARRMAEAAEAARRRHGWRAVVPGCPDWDLAYLVWHLA